MLKACWIPLTISLLVLLGTAAPVVDGPAPSHPIQARAIGCHEWFGLGIRAGDCATALQNMERMPNTVIDAATGRITTFKGVFSRGALDDRYRMPQHFVVGTCGILVDLASPGLPIASNWAFAASGAADLVEKCALPVGIGGMADHFGFSTVLMNPQAVNDQAHAMWDKCSRIIDAFWQFQDHLEMCLPQNWQAAAANLRAGLDPSPNIKTE